MKVQIKQIFDTDEKILTVAINNDLILTGGTSKYLKKILPNGEIIKIVKHEKSIRSISIYNEMFGCGSYDSKASLFYNNRFLETLEGPDTEIKCIRINKYIAIATRSGDVWIYNKEGEIDSMIHEDGDVKGVLWYNDLLFVYGYDNTIKLYSKGREWELLQKLEQDSTIWDLVIFNNKLIACDHNGYLWIYKKENVFKFYQRIEASKYPIFKMSIGDDHLFYISNRNIINILDKEFNLINSIYGQQKNNQEVKGYREDVNCIDYCEKSHRLIVGSDFMITIYQLDFS